MECIKRVYLGGPLNRFFGRTRTRWNSLPTSNPPLTVLIPTITHSPPFDRCLSSESSSCFFTWGLCIKKRYSKGGMGSSLIIRSLSGLTTCMTMDKILLSPHPTDRITSPGPRTMPGNTGHAAGPLSAPGCTLQLCSDMDHYLKRFELEDLQAVSKNGPRRWETSIKRIEEPMM